MEMRAASIDTLVLSGGGSNGMYMLGALDVLQEQGVLADVTHYIGCSIGSLLAVSCCMGHSIQSIKKTMQQMDVKTMFKPNIQHCLQGMGLISDEQFSVFVDTLLREASTMTFRELYDHTRKKISIAVTCLNTFQGNMLTTDTHPDMLIRDAVRMSCCVPFLFTGVKYNASGPHPPYTYVDGGLIDVFPISAARGNVLGITFKAADFSKKSITTLQEYIYCLFQTMIRRPPITPRASGTRQCILELDVGENTGFQLHATNDSMHTMFVEGSRQALQFMKKND